MACVSKARRISCTVCCGGHAQPVVFQVFADELANLRVVVHDQHVRFGVHPRKYTGIVAVTS